MRQLMVETLLFHNIISGGDSLSRDTINGAPETSVDGNSSIVEGNNGVNEAVTDVNGTVIMVLTQQLVALPRVEIMSIANQKTVLR